MNISRFSSYERLELGIAHVADRRRVFPELTVMENLLLGAYPKRARKKPKESLDFVFGLFPRLVERRSQIAATLSRGEQQVLAIGPGLMSDPQVLLLDEASLGQAPVAVNAIYEAQKEIGERWIAVLFVEQSVKKSLEEADRAYLLEAGKVVLSLGLVGG